MPELPGPDPTVFAPPPIVDTHVHLWDLNRSGWPGFREPLPSTAASWPATTSKPRAGLNIVKAVYMEVDVEPSQQEREARWVIELCRGGRYAPGRGGDLGPAGRGRLRPLHEAAGQRAGREGHSPGAPRAGDAPGLLPGRPLQKGNPAAGRAGTEF